MYKEFLAYLDDPNQPLPMAKSIAFLLFSEVIKRDGFSEEDATVEAREEILTKWVQIAQDKLTGNGGVAFYLPTVKQPNDMTEVAEALEKSSGQEFVPDIPEK